MRVAERERRLVIDGREAFPTCKQQSPGASVSL